MTVKVEGVPFGENMAELRQHRARMLMMNLALTVLKEAAWQPADVKTTTPAVRLALRVIHPMLGKPELLTMFWQELLRRGERPWHTPRGPLRGITEHLAKRGYPVWRTLR